MFSFGLSDLILFLIFLIVETIGLLALAVSVKKRYVIIFLNFGFWLLALGIFYGLVYFKVIV